MSKEKWDEIIPPHIRYFFSNLWDYIIVFHRFIMWDNYVAEDCHITKHWVNLGAHVSNKLCRICWGGYCLQSSFAYSSSLQMSVLCNIFFFCDMILLIWKVLSQSNSPWHASEICTCWEFSGYVSFDEPINNMTNMLFCYFILLCYSAIPAIQCQNQKLHPRFFKSVNFVVLTSESVALRGNWKV